jgi:hypothetical protein
MNKINKDEAESDEYYSEFMKIFEMKRNKT